MEAHVSQQQRRYLFFQTGGRTQRKRLYDWTDRKRVLSVLFPTLLQRRLPGYIPRHDSLLLIC